MDDEERVALLRRHWEFAATDQAITHEIYHDDAVLEFPQSGERFEGVENFREWRRVYPTDLARVVLLLVAAAVASGCGSAAVDTGPGTSPTSNSEPASSRSISETLPTLSPTDLPDGSVREAVISLPPPAATTTVSASSAAAVWSISPDDRIDHASETFTANVTRLGCNDGVTGEVFAPTIDIGETAVVVTFTVEPNPGDHTCPSNDEIPFVVDLGQPLGERQLIDGACLPGGESASTSFCVDGGVRRDRA